ncbi:unnamed protein product [Phytophthora lilii]|uniref:RxLR effector protein n=1 Tax=Phytophthora lilii TaxID=2077276 RepID=A0A9W6YIZ9_9STRA|nr:unnamed protein product [Phytophthora lilii]
MRVSYVLLAAAVTLLASNQVVSADSNYDQAKISTMTSAEIKAALIDGLSTRSLRAHKMKANGEERTVEERAAEQKKVDAQVLDNILSDHKYAKDTFRSWLQNGQTKEDIESRLKTQGLLTKYGTVVTQYGQYLSVLEERSA